MNRVNAYIIAVSLAIGVALGLVGSFLPEGAPLKTSYAVSGIGLIVGWMLLAARQARVAQDRVAAGLAIMALGEGVLFAGVSFGADVQTGVFGGSAALYFAGLLLVCLSAVFPLWTRVAGVIAAVLFITVALQVYAGQQVVVNSSPVAIGAYTLLSAVNIGWIITVLRGERRRL